MKLFRLDASAFARLAAKPRFERVVHPIAGGAALCTPETLRRAPLSVRRRALEHDVSARAWKEARDRVRFGWASVVCNRPPENVVKEATAWLVARPGRYLEYMGRGRFHDVRPGVTKLIYLDIAGGRRHYAFRVGGVEEAPEDVERDAAVAETYRAAGEWLRDPEARVVLTMGGGGYRLFAALAAVRALEFVLGGERTAIDEVWGTSGGAMLGYVFAHGHPLDAIERLAYLLYHGRTEDLPGLDLHTLGYMLRRLVHGRPVHAELRPELGAWVDAVDALYPPEARRPERVPFFAVASNTRWRHPVALTEARYAPPDCGDILVPCDPRVATGASMAVPLLLNPSRGRVPGYELDMWFDGGVVEENPVSLPFIKWQRDRRRDPQGTPPKLKLLLVNLNMRLSESWLLRRLPAGRVSRFTRTAADLVDLMMDSRTHGAVQMMREMGDVEVMSLTLNLGRLSFIARRSIPRLVRAGKIIEGWNVDVPGLRDGEA